MKPRLRTLSDLLEALAKPVRVRLLLVLEREEMSVGELASVVQLPQSTTSRHLKVLGGAGLVKQRTEGPATIFTLILDDLTPEVRALWLAVRTQAGDLAEEDQRRLAGVLAQRKLDAPAFFGRVAGRWDDMRKRFHGAVFTHQALLGLLPRGWVLA